MGSINTNDTIFARSEDFWNSYLTGRPSAPDGLFGRIFKYHEQHGGQWNLAHDAGAGNGPYTQKLREKFRAVILSDIAPDNVQWAQNRLGTDGFQYRVAKIEDADDIPAGTVDLMLATNVMHFADQQAVMKTAARQLKPGGTLAVAGFAAARFRSPEIQALWARIYVQGGRAVLKQSNDADATRVIMQRSSGFYNVVPLDEALFGHVQRVHLNMSAGGLTDLIPPEEVQYVAEPNYTGPRDTEIFEDEEGWAVMTDLKALKKHFASFPFSSLDPTAYAPLWQEMETLLPEGQTAEAYFPAKVILGKRR